MKTARKLVAGPALALALVAVQAAARADACENWPCFRGADGLNVAGDDPRLPTTWSSTENVVWKTQIPGFGWSSPIVWEDKVFVTTVTNDGSTEEPKKGLYSGGNRPEPSKDVHHWLVYCLDFDSGDVLWQAEAHSGPPGFARHLKNTYASETPVTDGERVYAYFGNVGIFTYDMDGQQVWSKRFSPRGMQFGWGTAASPALYENRLYIVSDNEDESFLVALDKKTGEEIWKVIREEKSNWVTPFVWKNEHRTELITAGSHLVRSYDLDGKLLWALGGMSSIAVPTPFAEHGLLYVSSGYVGDQVRPVWAIRPGASGNITLAEGQRSNEWIVWFKPQSGPYNPTPLVYDDYYYTLLDRGLLTCHDARTGEEVYGKQRIRRGAGAFTSSPWAYNGKIFALSEDGETFVISAGDEFAVEAKNSLDEMCMASPAIARGSLFLRTRSHLYRISDLSATEVRSRPQANPVRPDRAGRVRRAGADTGRTPEPGSPRIRSSRPTRLRAPSDPTGRSGHRPSPHSACAERWP
jgi:outer membrane protein assembly factor BamB